MDNLIDIMTACTCMLKLSKHDTEKEKAEAIEIFCKINEYEYNGSYVADDVRRFFKICNAVHQQRRHRFEQSFEPVFFCFKLQEKQTCNKCKDAAEH